MDPAIGAVGDVDNLIAVLSLSDGVAATVDLSRNCRYGDDVRTELLGSEGALFVDLLPTGRTRLATAQGIEVLDGSETEDATGAGVVGQAEAFAEAVRGGEREIPGAHESARATEVGIAIRRAVTSGESTPIDVRLG